ncbi:MAG: hypothetical protein ACXWVR_12120, partial [Rhodoplanes sp.]
AGSEDQIIAPPQVMSAASMVGTRPDEIKTLIAPSSHLGLFMGRGTLTCFWPEIVAWLDRPEHAEAAAPAPTEQEPQPQT